jgi:hypothetical protein
MKQEGTRQVLFFPLALRGKAFGFSVLQEHAVMTPIISIFFVMLIIRYLSIHISIKKQLPCQTAIEKQYSLPFP